MEAVKALEPPGELAHANRQQLATFYLGDALYGIGVMKVQEITRPMKMTRVPLAPAFVKGLINLRGQIATAVCLRTLFAIGGSSPPEQMNMICRVNNLLLSFQVDRIGDVIEVSDDLFEPSPDNTREGLRAYLGGIYKTPDHLLSVIDVEKIAGFLQEINQQLSHPHTETRGN